MRFMSSPRTTVLSVCIAALWAGLTGPAAAQSEPATLEIVWPPAQATVALGTDPERAIGVVVRSNFKLLPAGQCGSDRRCGHIHLKIDPQGDNCNLPGRPYNSMNSDFGGPLVKAHFGACAVASGAHVIGVLLADDRHQPVLVDGKPVTATVQVHTTAP